MKKLLGIVVLGLLWCSVGFAEWKNFTPNDPTEMYTYFDTTSIKKSDGYTQVMTLTDSPSPGPDGILSFKVLYNFDCSSFNAKIIQAESFTKNMGRGEGTSRELPDGWIDFDPNSVTYNLAKHVCNLSK
jgi:hypothetical protein|tara:strand:- start:170 stop:556 length:387 start_codon:yes stop_codon:yes gene_type:complete